MQILNRVFESLSRKGPPQSSTSRAQSAPVAPSLEAEFNFRLSEQLRRMVVQEVKRQYARRFHEATLHAVKNGLSDLFIAGEADIE